MDHITAFRQPLLWIKSYFSNVWTVRTGKEKIRQSLTALTDFGRSVMIGLKETQQYQRFVGRKQEAFVLKPNNLDVTPSYGNCGRRYAIEIIE